MEINYDEQHPYFKLMLDYHWMNGLPIVYRNKENKLVEHYSDGKINVIRDFNEEEQEKKYSFDKRYEEPFEDDGAYAD
jgi:hypothetical protein